MAIDPAVAALAGSLGGSSLTGLVAFVLFRAQAKAAQIEERTVTRRDAYSRLLASAALIGSTAYALRLTMQVRSGLKEGLDVATRTRKPVDPLQLHSELRSDIGPLYLAWSQVWTAGSPEAIRLGNQLVNAAADVMGVATERGQGRSGVAHYLVGVKWSSEQMTRLADATRVLATARRDFASLARQEAGLEVAELFL